jgi:two-component system chemotaxis response regulator CheB
MTNVAEKIRVLVVDDSAFMRTAIRKMLEKDDSIEVAGIARNGLMAIEEAKRIQPDVITLDIEMPEMDGLTALRHLKRVCEASILMISSLTSEGSQATLTALRNGASDFLAKDLSQVSLDIVKIETELLEKVHALGRPDRTAQRRQRRFAPGTDAPSAQTPPVLRVQDYDVLMIGSSTGGPPVLEHILGKLPADLGVPVVVAQHMPVLFTKVMSERLNNLSRLNIVHGEDRLPLLKGHVYIGQGGQHVRILRGISGRLTLEISPKPQEALYKPSVNELFASGSRACGARALAVVLTGMGEDGLIGARELHAQGGRILAQDHESCAVYGMPKAVTQAGLIMASLSPQGLTDALSTLH